MFRNSLSGGESVLFNGISGIDGSYPFPPTTVADLAALARGAKLERTFLDKLRSWLDAFLGRDRGSESEFDPSSLKSSGWGVIFPRNGDPRIREALRPLLDWRKGQATALDEKCYRELWGENGYTQGETMYDFLFRHEAEFGTVDPFQMPYYLLLVGGPDEIPFTFQYDLDVLYAVGRLDFNSLKEYASYAESVVAVERARATSTPGATNRMTFFCPDNPDNVSVRLRQELVGGLAARFAITPQPAWSIQSVLDQDATSEGLCHLLGGEGTPAFLFSACHGLVFPLGDARQRPKQGALLCRTRGGTTTLADAVSAEEISDRADLRGLIAFQFACFSAGTPGLELEDLEPTKRTLRADQSFTARLPQRLLGHPNGGALAVIGHVSRAWTYSFSGFGKAPQLNTFERVIRRILRGERVGHALEHFNLAFASKAASLMNLRELEAIAPSGGQRDAHLALAYCIAKDARNYVVLGDPAATASAPEPSQEPDHD
jgi:hypothetical protein